MPKNPLPIVLQLQKYALDGSKPVTDSLRLAKVVAAKLDLSDALVWIDQELDGYDVKTSDELPAYRRVHGIPEAQNPYHGWQTIIFEEGETAEAVSHVPITQPIASLEEVSLQAAKGDSLSYSPPAALKSSIIKAIGMPVDVRISIPRGSISNIVNAVRNLIVNWTISLEKAGILGDEMTFSSIEKAGASQVSQQFFIQNLGVLGNVSEQAHVTNIQKAKLDLDIVQIKSMVEQARGLEQLLPADIRAKFDPLLKEIAEEAESLKPEEGKLRRLLNSAKAVCEGATGNLVAEGIVRLIATILGAG